MGFVTYPGFFYDLIRLSPEEHLWRKALRRDYPWDKGESRRHFTGIQEAVPAGTPQHMDHMREKAGTRRSPYIQTSRFATSSSSSNASDLRGNHEVEPDLPIILHMAALRRLTATRAIGESPIRRIPEEIMRKRLRQETLLVYDGRTNEPDTPLCAIERSRTIAASTVRQPMNLGHELAYLRSLKYGWHAHQASDRRPRIPTSSDTRMRRILFYPYQTSMKTRHQP